MKVTFFVTLLTSLTMMITLNAYAEHVDPNDDFMYVRPPMTKNPRPKGIPNGDAVMFFPIVVEKRGGTLCRTYTSDWPLNNHIGVNSVVCTFSVKGQIIESREQSRPNNTGFIIKYLPTDYILVEGHYNADHCQSVAESKQQLLREIWDLKLSEKDRIHKYSFHVWLTFAEGFRLATKNREEISDQSVHTDQHSCQYQGV